MVFKGIIDRQPTTKDVLMRGLGSVAGQAIPSFAQSFLQNRQSKKIGEAAKQLTGHDISALPPEFQAKFLDQFAKQQAKQKLLESFLNKNIKPQAGEPLSSPEADLDRSPMDLSSLSSKERGALALVDPNLARLSLEEEKLAHKKSSEQQKLALQETKDYRDSLSSQSRGATELEPVLDQMERLISKGKLTNPVIAKLADKFGLVGILDPSSQQFNALSVGFLKDAKNIFGSRVTNFDLQTYIDKIPRLAQTDQGKKVLIDNFRTLGEASKTRNKVKNQIIRENKGTPPFDLEEEVNRRASPELDKLSEKFNRSFLEASKSPSGKIFMKSPDGIFGEVPPDRLQEALQKGYSLA